MRGHSRTGPIAEQLAALAVEPGARMCLSPTARPAIFEAVTGSVGSDAAEVIVVPALEFAVALGLVSRLYQVASEDRGLLPADVADTAYVARLAHRFARPGLTIDVEVRHSANPGDNLVALSRDNDVALLAMTTHGNRPFRRLAVPSLLRRVLRHATWPVMVETRH